MVIKHVEVIDLLQLLELAENQAKENHVMQAKIMKMINNLSVVSQEGSQKLE